jgi:hypothetical protein
VRRLARLHLDTKLLSSLLESLHVQCEECAGLGYREGKRWGTGQNAPHTTGAR